MTESPQSIGYRPSPGFPPTLLCEVEEEEEEALRRANAIDLARGWTVNKKTITTARGRKKNPWTLSSSKLGIHSFYATENCFWWERWADKCPIKSDCRFPAREGGIRR